MKLPALRPPSGFLVRSAPSSRWLPYPLLGVSPWSAGDAAIGRSATTCAVEQTRDRGRRAWGDKRLGLGTTAQASEPPGCRRTIQPLIRSQRLRGCPLDPAQVLPCGSCGGRDRGWGGAYRVPLPLTLRNPGQVVCLEQQVRGLGHEVLDRPPGPHGQDGKLLPRRLREDEVHVLLPLPARRPDGFGTLH